MLKRWIPVLAAVCLWAALAEAEGMEPIPGSHVRMQRPAGFEKADRFAGFQQEKSQASIVVVEIPDDVQRVSASFTDANLAAQGMSLMRRESVMLDNQPAQLLRISQRMHGDTYRKWILIFGNARRTAVVMAIFPADALEALGASLEESLLSARFADASLADAAADESPYTIHVEAPLQLALQLGHDRIYTESGDLPASSPAEAMFAVSQSTAPAAEDPKTFAETRITRFPGIQNVQILASEHVILDGMQGYEVQATGQDGDTCIGLYEVVLFDDRGYYTLMLGNVGYERWTDFLHHFRVAASSFRRNQTRK